MADSNPSLDPDWLEPLLAEIDRLARKSFLHVDPQAKADGTAVTELDEEISSLVIGNLRQLFPEAGIISEEEKEPHLPGASHQWVLDPVDGTASFARGFPIWGMGLGLMKDRDPLAGCIHFPILSETYLFTNGIFLLNGEEFMPPPPPAISDVENVLIGSGLHGMARLDKLKTHKLRNFGSNLYHMAALAAGRCEAMITPQAYIWDIVPALPFTRNRGYVERYLDGTPFSLHDLFDDTPPTFKLAKPLVIGTPEHVENLVKLLG